MSTLPKISLIIATYNRGALIGETLRSIQAQTYTNWECIIIDDGSSDDTHLEVEPFVSKDNRITYQNRPDTISKGANACRNYGFSISTGDYIKFFDSDDVMLPEHLSVSMDIMLSRKLDFVVADCCNFDEDGLRERPYETNKAYVAIEAGDFAKFRNGWITNDLLVGREIASQLVFNEQIRDLASEYQYCIRLLLLTQNGLLIPDILTHRRVHAGSIFVQMTDDDLKWKSLLGENKLYTAQYIEDIAPKYLVKWMLSGFMQYSFDIARTRKWPLHIWRGFIMIAKHFNLPKAIAFVLAICLAFLLKKGYNILKYARTPVADF